MLLKLTRRNLKTSVNILLYVILNFSSHQLRSKEIDVLKYRLKHSDPVRNVTVSEIYLIFHIILLTKNLRYESQLGELKIQMSNLVNNYVTKHKSSMRALRKHGVLKKLGNNDNVMILKVYNEYGMLIVSRSLYLLGFTKL